MQRMIDKERLIWNLSNSKCKCDRSCDVREYLDYENCKCRKRLVNKLVEECSENIDEVKIARISLAGHENEYKNKCKFFWPIWIVLCCVFVTISIGIGTVFVYFYWYSKNKFITRPNETTIY